MGQDLKEFYEHNEDFRRYVDRCADNCGQGKSVPVEQVLKSALTKEVAEYYQKQDIVVGSSSTYTPQGECV